MSTIKNEEIKSQRLYYIDAIKGIACFGVFLHHVFLNLLPATYSGQKSDSLIKGDFIFGISPLGLFINGNFWVCLFLIISSFILSKTVLEKKVIKFI